MNKTLKIWVQSSPGMKFEVSLNGVSITLALSDESDVFFVSNLKMPELLDLSITISGHSDSIIVYLIEEQTEKQIVLTLTNSAPSIYSVHKYSFTNTDFQDKLPESFIEEDFMLESGIRTVEEKYHLVDVFYATDRDRIERENILTGYGNKRADLSYGMCQVSIPENRKTGEIPRPIWWKLEFQENQEKHVVLLKNKLFEAADFFKALDNKIRPSAEKDTFVFIHGYNVSFDECVMRGAQMAYDLSFKGAPIVFSWPSKATVQGYLSDEDNVQYANSHLIGFLRDLKSKTTASKIHLIAHSMGNRALMRALLDLKNEIFEDGFLFNQIILAAPDIDAEIFLNDIAPKLSGCSKRTTLYASSKDKALAMSRTIRYDMRRAGESGEKICCAKDIDTVDASNVDTDLIGHGYFASTKQLITDIYLLLNDTPPERRNLQPRKQGEQRFWAFKF